MAASVNLVTEAAAPRPVQCGSVVARTSRTRCATVAISRRVAGILPKIARAPRACVLCRVRSWYPCHHVHTIADYTRAPSSTLACFVSAYAPTVSTASRPWSRMLCDAGNTRGQPPLLGSAHEHAGHQAPTQAPATPLQHPLLRDCGQRRCMVHQRVPRDRWDCRVCCGQRVWSVVAHGGRVGPFAACLLSERCVGVDSGEV